MKRCNLVLDDETKELLEKYTQRHKKTKTEVVRKALSLLLALEQGEVELTVPEGKKIPDSIIFS